VDILPSESAPALNETLQPRYAVYFAPPAQSSLWALAQRWLGRDCERDTVLEPPEVDGWTRAEIAAVTESPRRYGFHATLKPPFRLAPDLALRDLHDKLAGFAAGREAFVAPPLKISTIGPFLALTLSQPSPAMQALADAAVKDLDGLRAPLSAHDLERRLGKGLPPRQEDYVHSWGYPYVFEEFRFHMTLTGPIKETERRERLQSQLAALFRPELGSPVPVGEISLYSQENAERPFLLIDRFRLTTAAAGAAQGRVRS
jgi:putative phosphonate metabolism protein